MGAFSFILGLRRGNPEPCCFTLRLLSGGTLMISLLDRIARAETEADREQFVRGVLGVDKFRPGSFVAGWLAGSLITKIVTESKRK